MLMQYLGRLTAMVIFLSSGIFAQTPAPLPPAPDGNTKLPVRERERRIYVPYEEMEKVFADGGRGVFLPYREFLDLWNELTLKRDEETKPPVDAVVSKAEYVGKVEGQALVLEGKLALESFAKGWATVSLGNKGLTGLAEAITGKAVLKRAGDGYEVLLPEKGVYEITLKMIVPVTEINGRSHINAVFPRAAVSRLVMTLPGEGLELETKSGAFTSRQAGGSTEVSLVFGVDYASDLSWGLPQAVTTMTPLLLAQTMLESRIRAGSVATTANIDLRVMRAPMSEFKISVPAGQEVLGVKGDGVKTWSVAAGDGGRMLVSVSADKPVREELSFQLDLEAAVTTLPAEVAVPDLMIEGASYARGSAVLRSEEQYDVVPKTLESVVRTNAQDEIADGLIAVGSFRLLKQPYKLTATVEEARPQVDVTSLTRAEVLRDVMKLEAQFDYSVRRVGIFETKMTLPSGLAVSDVKGESIREWKVEPGVGGAASTLVMKLNKQTAENFSVVIMGRQLRAMPTEDVAVPVFTPVGVSRHEAKVGVSVHSSLEANTKAAGDLQQEDVNALPAEAKGRSATELVLAFRYRDAAKPATLGFKGRDPQVSAEVLTRIEAREQSTRHVWTVAFDVAYAAVDRVVVALPKAVADQLRVEPVSLRDVKEILKDHKPTEAESKLPDAANYAFWEIVLRSEKMGRFELKFGHEKQGALQAGKTGTVDLIPLHVPGAFQETGQVAVLKDNSLELRNAKPEGLEEIDARELHGDLQTPGVFQAYKYRAPPVKLSVEIAKNAYFAVPQAVITNADLKTAVSADEAQSTEVIYWVRNIDLQFLVVTLPAGATLVSDVFVGKDSQQPMRREGSEDLLVRLPSGGSAASAAFPVRFVYEVRSAKAGGKLGMAGKFSIKPATAVGVKVLDTRHRLYLPASYHFTRFDGALSETLSDRGWRSIRRLIDPLIPALGPVISRANDEAWKNPPAVPADVSSLYAPPVPEQGHLTTLRRLGEPAEITVTYRAKQVTYLYEAIAFMVVILAGVIGMGWRLGAKAGFIVIFTAAAILATGLLGSVNMLIAYSVLYALGAVIGLWVLVGVLRWFGGGRSQPPPRGDAPSPRFTPVTPAPTGAAPTVAAPTSLGEAMARAAAAGSPLRAETVTSDSAPVEVIQMPEVTEGDK